MASTRTWPLTASVIAACAAGCSSGSGGSTTALTPSQAGTLSVALIDAPVTDVTSIVLHIDTLRIKPAEGPALEFAYDPPLIVNLLELDADNSETLLDDEQVPAGSYEWMELVVSAAFDGESDSFVTTVNGGVEEVELQVPSGSVRLVSGFTVTANRETSFTIDWDTRRGLVRPPGLPGYLLRPAFRIVDMTAYGTLSGTVAVNTILAEESGCTADSSDLDVGNVVYIYAGAGVEPDDYGGAAPQPVAAVIASQGDGVDYEFSTILSPGPYTVAFTCQAGNDEPDTDQPELAESDEDTPVSFTARHDVEIEVDQESAVEF